MKLGLARFRDDDGLQDGGHDPDYGEYDSDYGGYDLEDGGYDPDDGEYDDHLHACPSSPSNVFPRR